MRILLWDIDGTLIRSARPGGYKEYTIPVLEEVFGTSGRLADMHVSGMTDLQIVFEALFKRFPNLKLAVPYDQLEFKEDATVYGLKTLPVSW